METSILVCSLNPIMGSEEAQDYFEATLYHKIQTDDIFHGVIMCQVFHLAHFNIPILGCYI